MARETVPETRKRLREAALQQLREAEKLGGKSAELYRELGAMYDDPKTADRAIEYYSRGLEVEAGHPQLRLNRALAYAQYLQDYKNARADLAEAAKVADSHADAGKIRVETQTCLGYVCARQKQVAAAQAAATLALLYERENGRTHFITLHNVACIFAELSLTDPDHARAHQDVCLTHLRRAIAEWRRVGKAPSEVSLIKNEPSFRSLRELPKFQELIADPKK